MSNHTYTVLDHRAIFFLKGRDRDSFLQGIITNDIDKINRRQDCLYAALLTPQGKFLHDLFIYKYDEETYAVEAERARLDELLKKMSMYKLRSDVQLEKSDHFNVAALWRYDSEPSGTHMYKDPRLEDLGYRILFEKESDLEGEKATFEEYDTFRLKLGVPDGSRDLPPEQAILLENNFDELQGIDWEKGCYMGQELIARTKHRGLVRKRLLPVNIEGRPPSFDSPLSYGTQKAGKMRSHNDRGTHGLALVRLEQAQAAIKNNVPLTTDDSQLHIQVPAWLRVF